MKDPCSIAPEAHALRHNLDSRVQQLRFTEPLETQFLDYLHTAQRKSALFTIATLTAIWVFYIGLDFWRMHLLQDPSKESQLFYGSLLLRFFVLVCFGCALYTLQRPSASRRHYDWSVAGSALACGLSIPVSTYTIKSIGLTETSVAMVLITSFIFFPLGVRQRLMVPIACVTTLCITLSGPLILYEPEDLKAHWVLTAVVWGHWMLSAVTAYHRESGLREQFLLRRLLNWEASHDPLTGLANRRMFHEHLDMCMRQSRRYKSPLFLIILDIDHFKLYNDMYGHGAGDAVLRQCSVLLQNIAQRPLDLAVRLGGEEFALVIYDMDAEHLPAHLKKFQTQLSALHVTHAASPTAAHVTVSMGGTLVLEQDSLDTAFQRADALLYQAKHQGRNRACLQTNEPFDNGNDSPILTI